LIDSPGDSHGGVSFFYLSPGFYRGFVADPEAFHETSRKTKHGKKTKRKLPKDSGNNPRQPHSIRDEFRSENMPFTAGITVHPARNGQARINLCGFDPCGTRIWWTTGAARDTRDIQGSVALHVTSCVEEIWKDQTLIELSSAEFRRLNEAWRANREGMQLQVGGGGGD